MAAGQMIESGEGFDYLSDDDRGDRPSSTMHGGPDRNPPMLKVLAEVTGTLSDVEKRVAILAERTEAVRLSVPTPPSDGGRPAPAPSMASPLVSELRTVADRLHRIEARLASLAAEIEL